MGKLHRDRVYAQAVLAGVADEGLRINRTGEVHVQVSAFGELGQKYAQRAVGPRAAS